MILHKKKYYLTKSNTYLPRIAWQWNPRLLKHHPNHTFCVYGLMLYISDNKYRSKRRVDPIYQESAKCSLYPNCSPPWNLWVGTVELRAKNVQCSSFPCDPHIPANKKMKTQIARQRIKQKKKTQHHMEEYSYARLDGWEERGERDDYKIIFFGLLESYQCFLPIS